MLSVRAREPGDRAAVAALMAAAADRVAAVDPRARMGRAPADGPGLVAVDADGTVRGHVRPVVQELAPDDDARMYAPDRSVGWADVAADGPAAAVALATALRTGTAEALLTGTAPAGTGAGTGPAGAAPAGAAPAGTAPARPAGAEADGLLWPAEDEVAAAWWSAAGLVPTGVYALRPPDPLPGPLPPGVTARPGTQADADRIVALHEEAVAFQAAASPYVRSLPSGAAGVRDRLASGKATSTVLARGGELLGVCEWWPVDGEGPPLPPGRYAYLNSVAVTGAARTGGLGRALVSAALAAAGPDLAGSTLWFSPPNPIASRVWPHLGWRPLWTAWERRAG